MYNIYKTLISILFNNTNFNYDNNTHISKNYIFGVISFHVLRLWWVICTRCRCWWYRITRRKIRCVCRIRIWLEWWLCCSRSWWCRSNRTRCTNMVHRGHNVIHCIYRRWRYRNIRWRKRWWIVRIIWRKISWIRWEMRRYVHWFHCFRSLCRWTPV